MPRRLPLRLLVFSLSLSLFAVSPGCRKGAGNPGWMLAGPEGAVAWDTLDTSGILETSYRDCGAEKKALRVNGDSSAVLHLLSPDFQVSGGQSVSFTFALRRTHARGKIFEARLRFLAADGKLVEDSLLYAIETRPQGDSHGDNRRWISYTRALQVPVEAVSARISLSCTPAAGQIELGETAFRRDEGWLGYASAFSPWLGQTPADKYVFTAGRIIEPQAAPEPSPREIQSGMLAFERKGLVDAWPWSNPRDTDRPAAFSEKVPRAATAPFAFGVKALADLPSVEASLARTFSGPQGELKTRPRVYQARFAANRLEGSWSRDFGVRTRLLENPRPKPLPSGEARFFWIDVPVPDNAAPGVYESELLLRAGDRISLTIPLRLEVLPVTLPTQLPDSAPQVGFYYYPPLDNPPQMELQLRDMTAHGISAVSLEGAFVNRAGEHALGLDLERVRQLHTLMLMLRRLGFVRPIPFFISDLNKRLGLPEAADKWSDDDKHLYERAVRMMDDTSRNWGWPRLMFFPVDEPANRPELMQLAHLTLGILHGMDGILVQCDLNSPGSIQELSKYLNAVVMQISSVTAETLEYERRNNVAPYFYLPAFGSSDVGSDAAFHRVIPGWFLPRTGARGIYYFAYQSPEGDPYDELDGTHRDWCAAYPSPDNADLWPSPEYQGIRRGIEDLRLVELTRNLCAACRASQDLSTRAAGEAAAGCLQKILDTLEPSGDGVIYQLHYKLEPYIAEKWRQELLGRVIEMQAKLNPGK